MMTNQIFDLEKEVQKLSHDIAVEKEALDSVVEIFRNSPVYNVKDKGGSVENYKYFVYPFKGFNLVNYSLYYTLGRFLAKFIAPTTEAIITVESDGIPVASFVAAEMGLPLIIAKSFHYNLPCVEFEQKTGYYARTMYMSQAVAGKEVALVDCMVSTGGTVKAMIDTVQNLASTTVNGVYCINNKSNYGNQQTELFGKDYKYLFDTAIKEERVEPDWSKSLKNIFWQGIDERFYDLAKNCALFSNFSKNGYQVGALIMAADTFEIVAWGFRKANMHAEQDALAMMRNNCPDWEKREFALYTTLEPCVYRNGNYTACADLINAIPQIRWVIIGETDTADQKINGAGIEKLRQSKHLRLIKTKEILRCVNPVVHFIK